MSSAIPVGSSGPAPSSFWSGAGGGIIGGLAGLIGTGLTTGLSVAESRRAWDKQKDWATRGPTYQMQGLRAAGLNPILAAGGGLGGASASSIAQAPIGDFASALTNSARTGVGIGRERIEKDILKAERDLRQTNAWNAKEQTWNLIDTNKLIDEQIASAKQTRLLQGLSLPYLKAQSDFFKTPLGQNAAKIQAGAQSIQPLINGVMSLTPLGQMTKGLGNVIKSSRQGKSVLQDKDFPW